MTQEEKYFVKLMNAGLSSADIARRLKMTEKEVEDTWRQISEGMVAQSQNGYAQLCASFTVMAHQYQLLGESLKTVAHVLDGVLDDTALRALISPDPEKTFERLRAQTIILKTFVAPDPESSLPTA